MPNMTEISSSVNIGEMATGLNTASGGVFAPLTLFTIFGVLVIVLSRRAAPQEAFMASSMVTTIIALFLLAAGFGSILWVTAFGLMWAVSAVMLYLHNAAK